MTWKTTTVERLLLGCIVGCLILMTAMACIAYSI